MLRNFFLTTEGDRNMFYKIKHIVFFLKILPCLFANIQDNNFIFGSFKGLRIGMERVNWNQTIICFKADVHGQAHARADQLKNKLYGSTLNSMRACGGAIC